MRNTERTFSLIFWLLLCVLAFALPAPVEAAVAVDANATGATGGATSPSINSNLTIGSATNLCLIVQVTLYIFGSNDISGIAATWNGGSPMTLIGSIAQGVTGGIGIEYLFGMVAPASGNHAISVSWTGSATLAAINGTSFSGCNQTGGATTFANETTSTGTGTAASLVVTNASGNMAINGVTGQDAMSAPSGTLMYNDAVDSGGAAQYSASVNPTFTWAQLSSKTWGMVGASIVAAPAGGVLGARLPLLGVGL